MYSNGCTAGMAIFKPPRMRRARVRVAGIVLLLWAFSLRSLRALPLEPSSQCGACHQVIYAQWSNSMHANALADPIFVAHFRKVSPADKATCLTCHAPFSRYLGDPELKNPLSREGVSCEFCHRVTGGEPGTGRFIPDFTGPRRGPLEDALDTYHPVAYSEFHTQSELCAVCHQSVNSNGVAVLDTYEEWKQGPYPNAGITCQKCHMPEDINQSAAQLTEASGRHTLIYHTFLGGHSRVTLQDAASLSLIPAWQKEGLEVVALVTNKESGHSLPTGLPSRRIVLSVTLQDSNGRALATLSRTYQRTLKDRQGLRIPDQDVARMFLESAGVETDNRIRPKETRRENFVFPKPTKQQGEVYSVRARLVYFLPLPFGDPPEIQVELASQEVLLKRPSSFGWLLILANLIVVIVLIGMLFVMRGGSRRVPDGKQ